VFFLAAFEPFTLASGMPVALFASFQKGDQKVWVGELLIEVGGHGRDGPEADLSISWRAGTHPIAWGIVRAMD
jgi:hypothetical protein